MIDEPIVFVLGAGASCSYGYPSGRELKRLCAEVVLRSIEQRDVFDFRRIQSECIVSKELCHEFAVALANSGQPSIDAFLNANRTRPGYDDIGKAAIAAVLLAYEAADQPMSDDWVSYLFELMIDGVHSVEALVKRNRVSFITFNYDRSLENRLLTKIQYSFGLDFETAVRWYSNIPIVHMYGTLGGFPVEPDEPEEAWKRAARTLRTIFDAQHDVSVIRQAKEFLGEAKHICCLGFGFHRENIQLIDLVEGASRLSGIIASSRFGITDQEWIRMMRPFTKFEVRLCETLSVDKCLDALREFPIF